MSHDQDDNAGEAAFARRFAAARARIRPDTDSGKLEFVPLAQSGERWQQSDAYATAPSYSRILFAIASTEPETGKMVAQPPEQPRPSRSQRGFLLSLIAISILMVLVVAVLTGIWLH